MRKSHLHGFHTKNTEGIENPSLRCLLKNHKKLSKSHHSHLRICLPLPHFVEGS